MCADWALLCVASMGTWAYLLIYLSRAAGVFSRINPAGDLLGGGAIDRTRSLLGQDDACFAVEIQARHGVDGGCAVGE